MIQPKVKINRKKREAKKEKITTTFIYIILIFAIVVLFFTAKAMFFSSQTNLQTSQVTTQMPMTSRMSLTPYDKELARQMMDKDGDGKCDVCGMDVNVCIESGQMQCNMDSKSTIGILGLQHIHADWKVYINGEAFDFTGKDHMTRMRSGSSVSSFIHVDSGAPTPEKTGDIIHMHATGVPIWIFFDSIELKLPDGMKAYINGKEISDYKNYVFNDLDKILITDGKGDLQNQLGSVTDFAKDHTKGSNTETSGEAMDSLAQSEIKLPANIQSSAPIQFKNFEEEVAYYKKNAKNPKNINIEKAILNMDKNLDGICDTCGMSILGCIESGMENM